MLRKMAFALSPQATLIAICFEGVQMELVLGLVIILLAVGGLALGSFFGRGPIKGSCGGMACLKDVACEGCPHKLGEDRT